ncbi:helix-turn-helix domain-containing protein (plasmid) [Streptomyces sp. BI20]|uniref:helix-turn-helix domain-containing protein n=1 Tax=Streptomyces sp. BI20 TaxID=3403460 RepID=UPI003C73F4FB
MSTPAPSPAPRRTRRPYAPRMPLVERRAQLLDAALAVIVADGYRAVSVDAVAKRAGVARSVVYGAYADLDALLAALLDREQARAFALLADAAPDPAAHPDPVGYAVETVRRAGAALRSDPDTWRLILLTPPGTPAAVHARVEADRRRVRRGVTTWLASHPTTPGRPAPDPEILAHALVACAEHFGRLALTDPGAIDTERLVTQVRLLLTALWTPPPTP